VIGAGVIHLAAVRSHLGSPAAVASFTGVGLIQILVGASLLQPSGLRLKRVAVVSVGAISVLAWLVSRTLGLPAMSGHAGREPVGLGDGAAIGLQLVALALVLLPVRDRSPNRRRPLPNSLMAMPVVAVSVIASLSLLSVPAHTGAPSPSVSALQVSHAIPRELTKRAVPVPAKASSTEDRGSTYGQRTDGHTTDGHSH